MQAEEAKRLTQLEKENARLKKLLAEAELEKAMLYLMPSRLPALSVRQQAELRLDRSAMHVACSLGFVHPDS
jgi:hypothetical protein